ncbi:Hpt domain-containing protein [Undibacterium sp. SXout20W]|uniref:Hpt domain-containing protein n=1 Tax=Undibacterium sp. SXout20W TaxID=3413051 RepID=UPI003BF0F6A8
MTSDFSNSSHLSQDQFDTGPLSWVMAEVREAVSNAGKMLKEALEQDPETRSTTILHAKSYLHQAHGALQIVDIDGVSNVTETIEELLERLQTAQLEMNAANVDVILDAFHAVLRYLEDLLSGATHQPVRLFPYYRALLELKGAERIHPADLFFPALSAQSKVPALAVTPAKAPASYTDLRQQFEKLLLTLLTSKDQQQQQTAARAMRDVVHSIDLAQTNPQAKAFWVVMCAFVEAFAEGNIDNQQYAKQIFGRINLQIRRLVEGVTAIPERLLRDALFFLAQARASTPIVESIRHAYQLENKVPADYDQKHYSQIAAGVQSTAKEQLAAVKNLWGRIANGENALADKFSQKMKDLADTGAGLNAPALSKLLRELSGIARHVVHSADREKLGIELATSLLFVETTLDQITRLPAHFSERADEITARLLSIVSGEEPQSQTAWMGEISREAQQRQTMGVLVSEMQASLRQVEKNLDEYFRDPAQHGSLKAVNDVLHQIGGALAILDQDDAMQAVEQTRDTITKFAEPIDENNQSLKAERHAEHQKVAQNIGALSFFIETLQAQPDAARKKFSFEADTGIFRSNLLEATAQKDILPHAEEAFDVAHGSHTSVEEVQSSPLITAEQELLHQQQESARLAVSLSENPDNTDIQTRLKDSLESERSVATLLDDQSASERAKMAIELLDKSMSEQTSENLQDIIAATSSAPDHQAPLAHVNLPQSDEAIDAELLDIFLTEAEEVLAFVQETLPLSKRDIENQDYLTSLRRSFHTLKGSSRMVGLNVFGETAWNVEQVMNLWLSESRSGTETLYALLDHTAKEMALWVEELKQHGHSSRNGSAIIAAAERVKAGQDLHDVPVEQASSHPELTKSTESTEFTPIELTHVFGQSDELLPPIETNGRVLDDNAISDLGLDNLSFDVNEQAVVTPNEAASEARVEPVELQATDFPVSSPLVTESDVVFHDDTAENSLSEALTLSPSDENLSKEAEFALPESEEFSVDLSPTPSMDELLAAALGTTASAANSVPDLSSAPQASANVPEDVETLSGIAESHVLSESVTDVPAASQISEPESAQESAQESALEPAFQSASQSAQEKIGNDNVLELVNTAKILEFPDLIKPVPSPTIDDNIKRIGDLEISLPLYSIYMAETDEIVRFLSQDFAEWRHEPHRNVTTHAIHASHTLAGSSATVGLKPLQELAHSLELVLQRLERHPVVLTSTEFDTLEHALDVAKRMLQKFALSELAEFVPDEVRRLEVLLQDVIGRSDAGADEEFITSTNEKLDLNDWIADAENIHDAAPSQAATTLMSQIDHHGSAINDELDHDLLPVFLEEGHDLLPMVGQLLRSWQEQPGDIAIPQSIARLMHTIKGSARMAGAMGLGQHIHDMETRIESLMHAGSLVRQPLLEDLLARHDHSMLLFDRLQHPDAHSAASATSLITESLTAAQELDQFQEDLAAKEKDGSAVTNAMASPQSSETLVNSNAAQKTAILSPATAATPPVPAAPVPLVRVRADVLDRLVNQAGEVSISRSRLENEVTTLRSSLSELTENVTRLRDQLREVEIQAETQITSRMAHSADREFDPLEFDRFTRLQELTRMMAESVSDVATVQTNLNRTIDGAATNLHTQARLTRELQQDLMRVRMIPFASVSERLYRVARQTAKEVDKRVNLDIRGTNVEMDRGVLEKMVGPFEHLLRNAIVHGIESREARRQLGKDETGELLIEVRQEGNEVVIRFNDDGQGLNLNVIREKAQSSGLLLSDETVSDVETANLIFEPGFSTVSEVTELAGRGVGMDVVRSEAASLGGRVEVATAAGKGAEFTIHLPLTLAVTQVVLLSSGGRTFAVPSVLVEQVQHLKSNALANAYNDGAIMWQEQRVRMHYLSSLLGYRDAIPTAQQYTPLLIMKSGTDRVAIHVDDIVGNREVVVKNIGPQLSRMIGIAGATVLGSGDIVLIINPVPLAQRVEHEHARLPQPGVETRNVGAVADIHETQYQEKSHTEAVQGLRTQHSVMVVDDSLTVRRVTQRLLVREGYQVILAKDGIDALEQLQSVTPDIMLVDIEMPRMDGFDLTRNVRSDARTSHIPIIMITSRTADKHRNYAKELGVNEYFGKPYREDDLLAAIRHFIESDHDVVV